MVDVLHLSIAFAAGMVLGLFHFGTLWLTVRQVPKARRPELLTLGSFLARTGVSVLGFYLVMGGHWERLLVCLFGFILMRIFLVRRWRCERTNLEAK
jgi:F1F0 ATPase subunit 2